MKKNPKISALLSLLFPGLGHFYLGQYLDGGVFLLVTGFLYYLAFLLKPQGNINSQALNFSSPRAYIFWAGFLFVYLYAIIDAYRKTPKS